MRKSNDHSLRTNAAVLLAAVGWPAVLPSQVQAQEAPDRREALGACAAEAHYG